MLDDGLTVPLGSAKQQALLALLLLHANEVVPRDRLIDELWGERPPPTAVKALQGYVCQPRKALPGNGSAITTRADGYLLELVPDELDALRFEGMVATARARAAASSVEEASRLFGQALALWRGRALAGLSFESYASTDIERLEELRLAVVMDRIDCELAVGGHHALVPELEALVLQYPLREHLRAQLMLALYRAGRQAEALESYQATRRDARRGLGRKPGPELQRLQSAILRQEPGLGLEARPRPMTRLASTLRGTVTVVMIEGRRMVRLHRAMTPDSFGALLIEYRSLLTGVLERWVATTSKAIPTRLRLRSRLRSRLYTLRSACREPSPLTSGRKHGGSRSASASTAAMPGSGGLVRLGRSAHSFVTPLKPAKSSSHRRRPRFSKTHSWATCAFTTEEFSERGEPDNRYAPRGSLQRRIVTWLHPGA